MVKSMHIWVVGGSAMNDLNKEEIEIKWKMLIWRMLLVICSITFIISWILFGSHRLEKLSSGLYILKYILVPVLVQALALAVGYYYIKAGTKDEKKQNYIVTAMMFVSFGIVAFIYYSISPIILLPCVTIVATAMFADQGLTIWTGVGVLILMVVNIVRYRLSVDGSLPQLCWIGALGVSMVFVVLMCAVVVIINKHTKALMNSIAGSYNRQVTLMSELMIDPMTGLYNRRSFEESLDKEIENVEATGAKSYVTIFDIDHFKEVNDTYGHSNGDIVIKALCKMMKEKSKDMGLAFRYGGEEFVILFHDVELSKVMNVVEDIRTEFRCYYFHFMNKDGITCSCGVAEYAKGESSKAWFNRADSALYKAKEGGRNRTVISE